MWFWDHYPLFSFLFMLYLVVFLLLEISLLHFFNDIICSGFSQCHKGQPVSDISLQIPGDHNVLNSLAVSDGKKFQLSVEVFLE